MVLTADEAVQIKRLYDEGYSQRKVAKKLGFDRNTVSKYLKLVEERISKARQREEEEKAESVPLADEQGSDKTLESEPMAANATDSYTDDAPCNEKVLKIDDASRYFNQTAPLPADNTVITPQVDFSQQSHQESAFSRVKDMMIELMEAKMMERMMEKISLENSDEDSFDRILKIKERQLEMRLFDKVIR